MQLWKNGALAILGCGAIYLGRCAAAAVPIAGDAAGEAVKEGVKLAWLGKSEISERVTLDEARQGAVQMGDELQLKRVGEEKKDGTINMAFKDDADQKIEIKLIRRTPRVTEIQIDVGWFGTYSLGDLVMRHLLADLGRGESARKVRGGSGDMKPLPPATTQGDD